MSIAPVRPANPAARPLAPHERPEYPLGRPARSAAAQPSPRPTPRPAAQPERRRHLEAVAAPAPTRSLLPFTLLCLSIMIGALVAVLLINTAMADTAYEIRDLKVELRQLHETRADMLTQLDLNASPQQLAATAASLGMVPASAMGFMSLESDTVSGVTGIR